MLSERGTFLRDAVLCAAVYVVLTAGVTVANELWFGYASSDVPWWGYALLWGTLFALAPLVAVIAAAASAVSPAPRLRLYLFAMVATVAVMEVLMLVDAGLSATAITLMALCGGIVWLFRRSRDLS